MRVVRALALALATSLVAPHVFAQRETSESAAAKAEFKTAQKLFGKGDYAGALAKFTQMVDATGSPNARLYVARCLRELDRLPEAYNEFSTTVADATALAESDKRYTATRDSAAAERTALEARVARVVIAVAKVPAGLQVELDGQRLPPEAFGATRVMAPGTVRVTARAPGYVAFDETRAVAAGEADTVTVTLHAAAAQQPPSSKPEPSPFRDDAPAAPKTVTEGGGVRTLGVVVLGVGVAGGAAFAVAGLMANARYDDLHAECTVKPCAEATHGDRVSGGKTLDLVANIGLVAGSVGVLAGTLMILFGGPTTRPVESGLGVEASPSAAGMRYRRSF